MKLPSNKEKVVVNAALKWREAQLEYRKSFSDKSYRAIKKSISKLEAACDALAAEKKRTTES